MWRARLTPADWLNDYWNGRGADERQDPPPTSALDPVLIDTLERLYARDDAQMPDPRFLDKVERFLLDATALGSGLVAVGPAVPSQPNRRTAPAASALPQPALLPRARRPRAWGLAQVATAALVLVSLVASFAVFRDAVRPGEHADRPIVLPGVDGATDTVLMQGTFDVIPSEASWMALERTTLAPGAVWPLGRSEDYGEGPWLYRVESGELTVNAEGPITVTRAGGTPTGVEAGTDVVLSAGDQGLTPSGVLSHLRNESQTPTIVMDARITTLSYGPTPPPGVSHVTLGDLGVYSPPQTPADVEVRQVVLLPTESLRVDGEPALVIAYVESGQVEVIDPIDAAAAANPLNTREAASGRHITIEGNGLGNLSAGRILQPAGAAPATILLFRVTPASPATATPMG